jgi:uncharacterized membrane protein
MHRGWNGYGAMNGYALGFPWMSLAMGGVFVILLALGIIALVRLAKRDRRAAEAPQERGIDILIGRFARGEVDAETFRSMKAELGSKV